MREIKFRVWDTKSKYMEHETAIGKGYGEDSFILFLGSGETFIIDKDIVKIMQYAGLKDKNGVEIYEGDIVNIYMPKVSCHTKESIVKKIVSFKNGSFILEWIDKNKKGFWATFISLSTDCDIEIIGNIYENQELLNEI